MSNHSIDFTNQVTFFHSQTTTRQFLFFFLLLPLSFFKSHPPKTPVLPGTSHPQIFASKKMGKNSFVGGDVFSEPRDFSQLTLPLCNICGCVWLKRKQIV